MKFFRQNYYAIVFIVMVGGFFIGYAAHWFRDWRLDWRWRQRCKVIR